MWSRGVTAAGSLVALLWLIGMSTTGCSTGECVTPAVERDGECVSSLECGGATRLEAGECVVDAPIDCGPGTELDPNENECFVTEQACGEGTAYSSEHQQCVPTDSVCVEGAHYDGDTGLCYPDAECEPGDVVDEEGFCISPVERRARQADVKAEGMTDPAMGGEPAQLGVAQPGDKLWFAGTMTTDTYGGVAPLDHFKFQAEAGERFEVAIYGLGLPDPMLAVRAEDGGFERFTAAATGQHKYRQVVIPEEGTYHIVVIPGDAEGDVRADDGWDYAGTIEQLEPVGAEAVEFTASAVQSTLSRDFDSFYTTDAFEAGEQVYVTWTYTPAQVKPVLQLWASPTEHVEDVTRSRELIGIVEPGGIVEVPETGELYLLADWSSSVGSPEGGYGINVHGPYSGELGWSEDVEVQFDAGADERAKLRYRTDSPDTPGRHVTVTDDDDQVVMTGRIDSIPMMEDQDEGKVMVRPVPHPGTYTATFEGIWNVPGFVPLVDIISRDHVREVTLDSDEWLTVTQYNADGGQVRVMITGEDDQVVEVADLGTDEVLEYAVDDDTSATVDVWAMNVTYASNLRVDAQVHALQEGPSVSVDARDLVVIGQQHPRGADVLAVMKDDDSGEVVFTDWVGDGEQRHWIADDAGDYTVFYLSVVDSEDVTVDSGVISGSSVLNFHAQTGARVELEQSNDDDHDVALALVDSEDQRMMVFDEFSAGTSYRFDAEWGGDYDVYFYDLANTTGLQVTTDVVDPISLGEFTVDQDDAPAVVEITHDYGTTLDLVVTDDDSDALISGKTFDDAVHHAAAFVGLETGSYTVGYRDVDGLGLSDDDVHIDTEIVVPQVLDDSEPVVTGQADENRFGDHAYYLVEFDETSFADVALRRLDGDGELTVTAYRTGHRRLANSAPTESDGQVLLRDLQLKAETPYILRVGGERMGWQTADFELRLDRL